VITAAEKNATRSEMEADSGVREERPSAKRKPAKKKHHTKAPKKKKK